MKTLRMLRTLTVAEGLEIQSHNLKMWQSLLQPEIFAKIQHEAEAHNGIGYESGYEVWRGQNITDFVLSIGYQNIGSN